MFASCTDLQVFVQGQLYCSIYFVIKAALVSLIHCYSAAEIKEHPFFEGVDWQLVYLQKCDPPIIPPRGEVNAADAFDIGSFDEEDTKGIKVHQRTLGSTELWITICCSMAGYQSCMGY